MRIRTKMGVLIVFAVCIAVLTIACAQPRSDVEDDGDILIGFAAPLTGDGAMEGQSALKAVKLAVEECNSSGGINGRKIVIDSQDDKGDTKEAASVAQKFAATDRIMAIIGHDYSVCHMVAGPVYQAAGIPSVTFMCSSPEVVDIGDTVFRVSANDDIAGRINGTYIAQNMGATTLATIFDNTEYGVSYTNAVRTKAEELGCTVTANETFVSGQDRDFTVQLTKIKETDPDALFICGYVAECGLIADQARKLGLKSRLFVPNTANSQHFLDMAKEAAEGTIVSTYFDRNVDDPVAKAFCEKYEARWNEDTFYICPYAYDAASVVIEGLRACDPINRANLRDEIEKTDISGVTGKITFNDRGDREISWNIMLEVVGNEFVIRDILEDVN